MPGCGMYSRPTLAEKARYNSLLKIKQTTATKKNTKNMFFYISMINYNKYTNKR